MRAAMSQACGEGLSSQRARRSLRSRETVCARISRLLSSAMSLAEAGYTCADRAKGVLQLLIKGPYPIGCIWLPCLP